MIYNKICEICNKPFTTKHNQDRYCKDKHIVKCPICGTEIELVTSMDKSRYVKLGFRTCSKQCASKHTMITNKLKYGYSTPFNRPEIKHKVAIIQQSDEYKRKLSDSQKRVRQNRTAEENKIIQDKIKNTNLNKYGVACSLNTDKSRQTMIERYGAPYTGQSEVLRKKMADTCTARYGVDNPFKSKEIQNKRKLTYQSQSPEYRQSIKQKQIDTYNRKTGYDYPSQCHIDKQVLDIIHNEDRLFKYIMKIPYEDRCISNISKNLGISFSYCFKLVNKITAKYSDCKINYFTSSFETDVLAFIDSLNIEYIRNDRHIISPFELDIYIPDKKVAIECNGTYYHSYKINKDKNYHYNKSKLCEEQGIRLIHIWEYEWYNERQQPILKNIIKGALGLNDNKIYARKCNIEVIPSKDMKQFFNDNNIQGFRPGKFAICLKYNDEIVMSYMMGSAFFGKGKYEWEVIRGATKLNTTVIGGASKIWKYFINNYSPKSIVYYVDYNYFNGKSLPYLDLTYVKTQPSFKNYFIKDNTIKNRDPMHHKQIKEGYEDGSILQIWNAGSKVYVWESN